MPESREDRERRNDSALQIADLAMTFLRAFLEGRAAIVISSPGNAIEGPTLTEITLRPPFS